MRLLLDKEESFRLSRAGVTDPSSPSGLTDRIRYRAAVERYTAAVLKEHGLCPGGYDIRDVAGSDTSTAITVVCLAP